MRVGFVCYEMFRPGGIRIYGHELLNHFADMGIDLVLFSPPPEPALSRNLDPRVKVTSIPISPTPMTSALSFWAQLRQAVRQQERGGTFDVIHSNCMDDVLLSKRTSAEAIRVVTVHHLGASVIQTAKIGYFKALRGVTKEYGPALIAERLSIERADHIIAVSRFTRMEVLKNYPKMEATRVTAIYNGLERRAYPSDTRRQHALRQKWGVEEGKRVLLFAGRLEERKGLRFLFHAFSLLPEATGAKLLVAGSGDPRVYRRLSKRLDIHEKVAFLGFLTESDLSVAYSIADVVVQPSLVEGFGFAAAEAVLRGIPVVATRVGVVPEIVRDNIDGVLVEYGAVEALAAAIRRVLETPRQSYASRGQLGKQMHWDNTARETLNIYERLLERGSVSASRN